MTFLHRFQAATGGNLAVEFALIVPILIAIALGTFDGARLFHAQLQIISAAHAGVQYGMRDLGTAADNAAMEQAARTDAGTAPVQVSARQFCACSTEVVCGGFCGSGEAASRYVQVSTALEVPLLFGYPGFPNPVRLETSRTMRVN